MTARRLTVSRHYPESRAIAHRRPQQVTPMSFLRLPGPLAGRGGLAIGANVRVEVSAGRLVVGTGRARVHRAAAMR